MAGFLGPGRITLGADLRGIVAGVDGAVGGSGPATAGVPGTAPLNKVNLKAVLRKIRRSACTTICSLIEVPPVTWM